MQPLPLSNDGQHLAANLQAASSAPIPTAEDTIHIAGVGSGFYKAYERLRNVAEYTEQHLLLRAAIERFLRRTILFRGSPRQLGQELIVELTEAGYLKNDTISHVVAAHIDSYIAQYIQLAHTIEREHRIPHDKARQWTLQVLSVTIEKILVPHLVNDAFIDFAFVHYQRAIDLAAFEVTDIELFDDALYVAVHRALLKSDTATIRFSMMIRSRHKEQSTQHFVDVCQTVDRLFQDQLTNRLARLVSRYGAPLRVLREVVMDDPEAAAKVRNRPTLLAKARDIAEQQYDLVHNRLSKGILRAIAFIFITKVIIGLAIEVPYDLLQTGAIALLPLVINLLFPAFYMATARWSIAKPGEHNTEAIINTIDRTLYQTDRPPLEYRVQRRVDSSQLNAFFNGIYALTFLFSFGVAVWVLHLLQFSIVHGIIFFIFFSAVSFLRFRLIQSARELELVDHRQSVISALSDFFYTPFIRLGMWLSDKYKKVNIITVLLDFAIELPLKSSLRLLTQWAGFMRDKREEL